MLGCAPYGNHDRDGTPGSDARPSRIDPPRRRGDQRDLVAAAARPLPRPGGHDQARCEHRAGQHLVGPRPAPPDGRLRHLRVGDPGQGRQGLPALRVLGDPALEVVLGQHQRCDHLGDDPRRDHQTGQVPDDRAAGRGQRERCGQLRVRPHPADGHDHPVLQRPLQPLPAVHSIDCVRAVLLHDVDVHRGRGGQRILSRPDQPGATPAAAVVLPFPGPVRDEGPESSQVRNPGRPVQAQSVGAAVRVLPQRDLRQPHDARPAGCPTWSG